MTLGHALDESVALAVVNENHRLRVGLNGDSRMASIAMFSCNHRSVLSVSNLFLDFNKQRNIG
jgi:hypothetical protein